MSDPLSPVTSLTHRADQLPEDDQILLALREPADADSPEEPLVHEGVQLEPYRSFFSVLTTIVAGGAGAWVMVGYAPPDKLRRKCQLPSKPGDLDLLVGKLTNDGSVDLDSPILAVEVGRVLLRRGDAEEAPLGDERKDKQASDLIAWPFEYVAVAGIIPEQTNGVNPPRWLHAPTIAPESLLPELQRFPPPLGLLAHAQTAIPGEDPAKTGTGVTAAWLRKPSLRGLEHDERWRLLRSGLKEELEAGVAFRWNGVAGYLILRCRDSRCKRWVMVPQDVPITDTLRPPCAEHSESDPALGGQGAALLKQMATPIPVCVTLR